MDATPRRSAAENWQTETSVDLSGYARVIRQRWAVLVASTVVGALAVLAVTPSDTGRSVPYTAVATLVQTPGGAVATVVDPYVTEASLDTIALFIKTGEIPRLAAERLGYENDPRLLVSQITVNTDPFSGAITVSTTSRDGDRAAEVVNAFADETVAYFGAQAADQREAQITALEERLVDVQGALAQAEADLARNPGSVQLQAERAAESDRYAAVYAELQDVRAGSVADAQVAILQRAAPVVSSSAGAVLAPVGRPLRVALGAALGLLLGLGLVILLERADARVRSRADIADALHLPVLAEIPEIGRSERRRTTISTVTDPLRAVAEAYRNVRSALLLPSATAESAAKAPQVLLVTSGHAREGKTTSVANIAAGLAEIGRTVIVLDADFRAPNAHAYFDVAPGPGISDHLSDVAGLPLEALVRPTNVAGVSLVTAGTLLESPAVLPSKLRPVVARARRLADVVIIDSAPLLHANDALDIVPCVDSVLIVVRSGRLSVASAHRVAELLSRFRVPVLGAVLVGSRSLPKRWAYGYDGYYGGPSRPAEDAAAGAGAAQSGNDPDGGGEPRTRGRRAARRGSEPATGRVLPAEASSAANAVSEGSGASVSAE